MTTTLITGGTVVELKFDKEADVGDLRERLTKAGYADAVVQTFGASNDIVVRLQPEEGQTNANQTGDSVLAAVQSGEALLTARDELKFVVSDELSLLWKINDMLI